MTPASPNPQAGGEGESARNIKQDRDDDFHLFARDADDFDFSAEYSYDDPAPFLAAHQDDTPTPPPEDELDPEWYLHVSPPDDELGWEPPENADELYASTLAYEPSDDPDELYDGTIDDAFAASEPVCEPQDAAGDQRMEPRPAIDDQPASKVATLVAEDEQPVREAPELAIIELSRLSWLENLPDMEQAMVLRCLAENEDGDARLFAQLFQGRCIYDHTEGAWYLWQGHYWAKDRHELAPLLVCECVARVYQEVNLRLGTDTRQEVQNMVKQLTRRVWDLKSLGRARRVLELARSRLPIRAEQWDTYPWLLGTAEGVIELRTGNLRPGRPTDFLRTIIPTKWRGLDEPAPRFELFLSEVFAGRPEQARTELIAFLQRALGYGITGNVREHIFLLFYGEEGRNGKDTLMSILKHVLGDTVGAVSHDVLISNGRNPSPGAATSHLCRLQGKRIAWANETSQGARFDVGQVKNLTGGSAITARELYGSEFSFEPSHLLVLLTNHKPHADASDAAFWERLCPVIFNQRFVDQPAQPNERKRDTTLHAALGAEASGILAWLVRGCLNWQKLSLDIPTEVRQARLDYLEEEDTLGDFIRECCVLDPKASISASQLYAAYKTWATDSGYRMPSSKVFGMQMKKRAKWSRKIRSVCYIGIRLEELKDT